MGWVFFYTQVFSEGPFDFCYDLGEKCHSSVVSKVLSTIAYIQLPRELSVANSHDETNLQNYIMADLPYI